MALKPGEEGAWNRWPSSSSGAFWCRARSSCVLRAAATFQFLVAELNWNITVGTGVSAMMTRKAMPDVSHLQSKYYVSEGRNGDELSSNLNTPTRVLFFFGLKEQSTVHSHGCNKVIADEKADCWIIPQACSSIRIKNIHRRVHLITAPELRKDRRVCRVARLDEEDQSDEV
jgi:hypothetical protein